MKNYLQMLMLLGLISSIALTRSMEREEPEQLSPTRTILESVGGLPNELWFEILSDTFFDKNIFTNAFDIFEGMEEVNRHLSKTFVNVLSICRSFLDFKDEFFKLKAGLLAFYRVKLKEQFLESREGKEGLHPKTGEWSSDQVFNHKIAKFLSIEMHDNDDLLHKLLKNYYLSETSKTKYAHLLIFFGANINRQDEFGHTALIMAAWLNHKQTVEMLLTLGADVNFQDNEENTDLMWTKVGDKDGHTALIAASVNGHKEIVKMLISNGADVNLKNKNGETALMLAIDGAPLTSNSLSWTANDNHKEIVKIILAHGANVNIKNNNGKTALDFAQKHDRQDLVKLLKGEQSSCLVS